jgi:hypothetical protein
VVAIRLPSLWEPRWYSDEGTFTTVAWFHSQGMPLYTGVFDVNPPGIYWLYGLLLRAGGDQHHIIVQGALLLGVVVAVLCLFSVARRWFGPGVAVSAALLCAAGLSLPTLDGDLLNVEIAALPFFMGALVLVCQKDIRWAFAAGVLAAGALLIRPSYLVDCATLLIALSTGTRPLRRLALAVGGGLLVLGSAALLLIPGNSLQAYVGEVSSVQRAYVVWANGGSLLPLALRLALLAAVAIAWYWRMSSRPWRLLAIWLPASVAGASLTPRELSHYAVEVIPPLAVAIAALAVHALRVVHTRRPGLHIAAAALAVPAALIMLIGAAEAVLILPAQEVAFLQRTHAPPPFLHNFSYAGLPGYYGRWLSSISGQPLRAQGLSGFPGPIREELAEAERLDLLARDSHTRVLVLGDRAWVYFLARLPAATRYVAQNSGFRLLPRAPAEVAAALDGHRAQLVAIADAPAGDWLGRLESDGYRPVASDPWPTFAAP